MFFIFISSIESFKIEKKLLILKDNFCIKEIISFLCVSKDDFDENNKIIIPLKELDKVKNEKNKNKNDKSNINNLINNTNRTTRTEGRKNNIFNINKGINESNGITYVTNRTSSNIRNRNLKSKEQNGRITNKSNKSNGKVYKRTTV